MDRQSHQTGNGGRALKDDGRTMQAKMRLAQQDWAVVRMGAAKCLPPKAT